MWQTQTWIIGYENEIVLPIPGGHVVAAGIGGEKEYGLSLKTWEIDSPFTVI